MRSVPSMENGTPLIDAGTDTTCPMAVRVLAGMSMSQSGASMTQSSRGTFCWTTVPLARTATWPWASAEIPATPAATVMMRERMEGTSEWGLRRLTNHSSAASHVREQPRSLDQSSVLTENPLPNPHED